ncbi:hypothetical protein [Streptomyces canus]|uniref:hypothetical protein n=1 Tax=Streptomyces canus TaxID=58343 RepID=UPI0033B1996E
MAAVTLPRSALPIVQVAMGLIIGGVAFGVGMSPLAQAIVADAPSLLIISTLVGAATAFTANNALHTEPRYVRGLAVFHSPRAEARPGRNLARWMLGGIVAGALLAPFNSSFRWAMNAVFGASAGVPASFMTVMLYGLGSGVLIGALTGGYQWAEVARGSNRAGTPIGSLRSDREVGLLRVGLILSWVTAFSGLSLLEPRDDALLGMLIWICGALLLGLFSGSRAWFAYAVAAGWTALRGDLPFRLMPFLDDAYRLGLLRTVGPVYQFRHAEFQDHLASPYLTRAPAADPEPSPRYGRSVLLGGLLGVGVGSAIGIGTSALAASTSTTISYVALIAGLAILILSRAIWLHRRRRAATSRDTD